MRRRWALAGLAAAATVVAEIVLRHAAHPLHAWHVVPGFDLGYGFVGCALIVVVSKALGRAGVQKPDSYYEPEE